ncbi:MAG TPA: peptidyl-dipeptidase Dcp [Rhodanobacteraceae bacterium]|nr:peptidyl-dipeptidase Dcp [Rhodanobacteraceae bacterium]
MFRARVLLTIAIAMTVSACNESPNDTTATEEATPAAPTPSAPATPAPAPAAANPFAAASTLPFHAPPFDKIEDSDYQPAIEEGMKQQLAEIEKIADNPDPATFENTYVAMEKTGAMLHRVLQAFGAVSGANTNDTLQKVQEEEAPKLAAHQDAIYLNPKLFARVEAVYDQRDTLELDPESARLVEVVYRDFVHAGAKLSDADKTQLKQLNEQESTLSAQFQNKLLAAAKAGALVVDDKAALAGMSDADIAAAAQAAEGRKLDGKWVVPLQNTTQQPALSSLSDRDTRHKLFEASWTRAEKNDANDTRDTIAEMARIRADKTRLLGFDNYAGWKLEDQMAKTPSTVMKFLDQLVPPATARARAEAKDIQAVIDKDQAALKKDTFKLEPWDWEFYAEQVRKAKYDLDADQIKPYFELDSVLQNGVFHAANQLYGLTFKERKDIPVYQPDVRVFEVFDKDGSSMALFYCDYYKRDNKGGGAWMDNLVTQSKLLGTKPVIYNVANFTKPAPGQPALLSFDDVITMFHEFGHALHGMFADEQYPTLSGTSTARDFVEFPSQFNEHWALDPKVFANYAKNYKTGAPMPQALVDKLKNSQLFNKGYDMTELLSAALLDMSWHTLPADAPKQDVDRFEAESLVENHVDLSYVPPRYRSSYFMHIWGNGYAAGYYAYLWTQMLADDAFEWFKEHGGLTRENGDRFRAMVLSRGNTEDLAKMYKDWRGQEPSIEPMLEDRGLKGTAR